MLLAFDFVSAPFHQHLHDGELAPLAHKAQHTMAQAGDHHAESVEHALASHATAAIRSVRSLWAQLPPADDSETQPALLAVALLLATVRKPPSAFWLPDRDRADFATHRSLPPAGRAPPPHA